MTRPKWLQFKDKVNALNIEKKRQQAKRAQRQQAKRAQTKTYTKYKLSQ